MGQGFPPEEGPFMFQTAAQWRKEWLSRGLCWWVMTLHNFTALDSENETSMRRLHSFKPRQTGCRLEGKLTSFSQFHPRSSPPPHANEMCQSQDTLPAAESIASAGQVRSGPLPISLAGNQECPPTTSTTSTPTPPSLANGSYQTHQEICDRTVLRPWEACHQLPQRWRIMCKCFASVCFLSVYARLLFLHKLNVMERQAHKVSRREHQCFCFAGRERQDPLFIH